MRVEVILLDIFFCVCLWMWMCVGGKRCRRRKEKKRRISRKGRQGARRCVCDHVIFPSMRTTPRARFEQTGRTVCPTVCLPFAANKTLFACRLSVYNNTRIIVSACFMFFLSFFFCVHNHTYIHQHSHHQHTLCRNRHRDLLQPHSHHQHHCNKDDDALIRLLF